MPKKTIIFIASLLFLILVSFLVLGPKRQEIVLEEPGLHRHGDGPLHSD